MGKISEMSDEEYTAYRSEICRKSQRKRREKARMEGMCIICCKRPARVGRSTCAECSGHYGDIAYKKRQEYMERGMCLRCGQEPPMIYHKYCKACEEIIAARRNKKKEKKDD